ncbi:hypothetical protein BH09VER1_BH09VER1_48250 [soil metagenome]
MSEPPEIAASKGRSFYHKAATLSAWAVPLAVAVTVAISVGFARDEADLRRTMGLIGGVVSMMLMVAGLLAGIVALFGISEHGKKGILGRAVTGIILATVMLSGAVITIFTVRETRDRLREAQRERATAMEKDAETQRKVAADLALAEAQLKEETRKWRNAQKGRGEACAGKAAGAGLRIKFLL